jgi:hypothetical protein
MKTFKKIIDYLWRPLANEGGFMSDFKVDEDIDAPEMSEVEKQLSQKLMNYIAHLEKTNKALLPALYEMLGYQMESGKLSKMVWEDVYAGMNPIQRAQADDLLESYKYLGMARRGEEGFDPGLERDIRRQKLTDKEEFTRQFGSRNYLRSSGGARAYDLMQERELVTRDDARWKAMGIYNAMVNRGQGQYNQSRYGDFASLMGLYNPGMVLQGYKDAQQPFQYYAGLGLTADQLKLQAEMFNIEQAQAFGKGAYTGAGGGSSASVGPYSASSGSM